MSLGLDPEDNEPADMEDLSCWQMVQDLLGHDRASWTDWEVEFIGDMEEKMIEMEESGEEFSDVTLFTAKQMEKIVEMWNEHIDDDPFSGGDSGET